MTDTPYVVIDTQSGLLSRDVPPDVAAALVRMTQPEFFFNLDIYGEAFADRFLVIMDWRSSQYQSREVTLH